MKKLTIESNVYDTFFEIGNKVLENLNSDKKLNTLSENIDKLNDIIHENNPDAPSQETFGRKLHYIVGDNINLIRKYLDNSKEVKDLKTIFLGVFEILEISKEKAIFLDINTGKKYEIIGESTFSESSLETDFMEGDLIISHLINIDKERYNMKIFYSIPQKKLGLEKEEFEKIKLVHRYILKGACDGLKLEERMAEIKKIKNKSGTEEIEINYFKRIKNILQKPLGKKKLKQAQKILKSGSEDSYNEFLDFLKNFKIEDSQLKLVKEYASKHLQEDIKTPEQEKQEEFNERLNFVMQIFSEILYDEDGIDLSLGTEFTKKDVNKINKKRTKWLKEKNTLLGNKTPEEFLQEVDQDYNIENLKLKQISEEELNFYDGYNYQFSDEEVKIYEKAIKYNKKQNFLLAYKEFEKILEKHSGFFRLRANYLIARFNCLLVKYIEEPWSEIALEELEEDFEYIKNIDAELKKIEKLKPGYEMVDNIKKALDKNKDMIQVSIGTAHFSFYGKKAEKLMNKGEKAVIKYLESEIKDFSIEEFISEIKAKGSVIALNYEEEGRYLKKLTGARETMFIKLFNFLWSKNKQKDDYIIDDAKYIYNEILIISKDKYGNEKENWDLDKINEFGEIIEKITKLAGKKNTLKEFNFCVESGSIIEPEYLLHDIEGLEYKKKFKNIFNSIGYEWEELEEDKEV